MPKKSSKNIQTLESSSIENALSVDAKHEGNDDAIIVSSEIPLRFFAGITCANAQCQQRFPALLNYSEYPPQCPQCGAMAKVVGVKPQRSQTNQ